MVDRLSPLKSAMIGGRYGRVGKTGVTLGERPVTDLWQIAGWSNFAVAATPVLEALGLTGCGDYRTSRRAGSATCYRIAPDKMLIEGGGDVSAFMSENLATLDLSHARTAITLGGVNARDVLAQAIAIDVCPDIFVENQFLQTGIHHVPVLIHCLGPERFEILVPVTWAEAIWEAMCLNASPHGYEILEAAG